MLPESQRSAWEALGWDSESWAGREPPPRSAAASWQVLSPDQRAAALHGLGYTKESWESNAVSGWDRGRLDDGSRRRGRPPRSPALGSGDPPERTSVPAGPLFGRSKDGGSAPSLIDRARNLARDVAKVISPTLADGLSEPVIVNDLETTVYLDDSPSMKESVGGGGGWFSSGSTRLDEGKKVVRWLSPLLTPSPCRVLKFSNRPTVLSPRDEEGGDSSGTLALGGWNGSGFGTYLWHMIQQDVLERYVPGTGKLRLVVVTDGEDNMSPAGYTGMRGMDPMMRTLQREGYDIEWHIVVVGSDRGLKRYEALAGATGGSFLAVPNTFDETKNDSSRFYEAVESSVETGNRQRRRERQHQYEIDAKSGKVERVDWYKALPPGDK